MEENEFSSSPYQQSNDTYKIWIKFDKEQTLEPKIEELFVALSPDLDPLCIQGLHDMITTENQGSKGYIESCFQSVISVQHHSIFQ